MKRNKYTPEIEEFIRNNASLYKREKLRQYVNNTFNIVITKDQFHQYLWRHSIRCKDYNISKVRNLLNKKPIGYEYTKSDGMVLVKIGENKWEYKQRLIYQQYHHCKLTTDDYIIFLDHDRTNFDINNLMRINRRESAILSNQQLFSSNPDVTKVGITYADLIITIRERKKRL